MILPRKRLLVDIFFTRRLPKSLAFCEFASVNFEPWSQKMKFVKLWDLLRYSERTTSKTPTRQKLAIRGRLSLRYQPSYPPMTPYRNPSKFYLVPDLMNRAIFRRICMESSQHNWVFPSLQKPAFPNSNSTRNLVDEEPLCGCATSKSLFNYLSQFIASNPNKLVLKASGADPLQAFSSYIVTFM